MQESIIVTENIMSNLSIKAMDTENTMSSRSNKAMAMESIMNNTKNKYMDMENTTSSPSIKAMDMGNSTTLQHLSIPPIQMVSMNYTTKRIRWSTGTMNTSIRIM